MDLSRQLKKIKEKGIKEVIPSVKDKVRDKCCRLKYLLPAWKIANVFIVHGDDIEVFDNNMGEDDELGLPAEPDHGWLMQKPEEGYPCTALTPDGCKFELEGGEKPHRCKIHPSVPPEKTADLIKTCSYKFDKDGNRSGECDGCGRIK